MEILRQTEKENNSFFLKRVETELKRESEVLFQAGDKFYYVQEADEGFDVNIFKNEEDIFDEDDEINFDMVSDGGVITKFKEIKSLL